MFKQLFKNRLFQLFFIAGFLFISRNVFSQMSTPNLSAVVTDAQIIAIARDGNGTTYIGGDFTTVGGIFRNRIAAIDNTGAVTSWNPNANNTVISLAVSPDNSTVYVGGAFTGANSIGGATRNNIAALSATTGLATSWNPNSSNYVRAITLNSDGSVIYAGGDFFIIGGQARSRLAALNNTTGAASSWNPGISGGSFLVDTLAISLDGSIIYAGGDFTFAGGAARRNLVAIDTSTGSATSWNPSPDSSVYSLLLNGSTLYVGGSFGNIGGAGRSRIAAVSTSTGNATSWDPNLSKGGAGYASSIVLSGSTVYVGGAFDTVNGGTARNNLASFDITTAVASAWNPNANDTVNAIALSNTSVYAGGSFTTIGGVSRTYFAEFDQPTVSLSASPTSISESGGTSTVTATLSGATSQDVTVNLTFGGTATNITNYTRSATSITIPAGSTTGTITITGVNDGKYNNDLTVIPTLGSITNGTAGSPNSATITITNVNPAPTVTLSVNNSSISEAGGVATVTATLSTVSALDTTINLSFGGTAVNGTNYSRSGTSIIITAGSTTGTITITGINQGVYHNPDLTVITSISSVTNGTPGSPSSVTITLTNVNAKPVVTLSASPTSLVSMGDSSLVTVTLNTASGVDTTINLSFGGTAVLNTNYNVSANTITVSAGTTNGTMTITRISAPTVGPDLTVIPSISSVVASNATIGSPSSETITLNNSTPALSINSPSALENAGTLTFVVTLSAVSSSTVTVDYATSNGTAIAGTNYVATSGTLTFNPGVSSQSIDVSLLDTSFGQGNSKIFNMTLSNPLHATLAFDVGIGTIEGVNGGGGTVTINPIGGNTITVGSSDALIVLESSTTIASPSYSWAITSTTTGNLGEAGFLSNTNEASALYHIPSNSPSQTVTITLTVTGASSAIGAFFDPNRKASFATTSGVAVTQIQINGTGPIEGSGGGCSLTEVQSPLRLFSCIGLFFPLSILLEMRRRKLKNSYKRATYPPLQ